ncbi:MAG: helix-turn-helix domain-containing protein [Defluviitaleaceae bacterium]|nr:helix-turn-helix domain-containing protein [Defluviitaleaceae bacterium]
MLPQRIKQLRLENNLSQQAIAQKLNLTQQAIAKWEGGDSKPDSDNINELARLFGVTTDYLLGLEEFSQKKEPLEKEALKLAITLEKMGLIDPAKDLAPQIEILLKFIERNKDFIVELSKKHD